MSDVTALIVTYNSASVLPTCLADVARAGLPAIVIDNASSDGTIEIASKAGAKVICNGQNQGFGRAMNQGLDAAATRFCLLLNPDIAFDADAPGKLAEIGRNTPNAAIIAPQLVEPDGRRFALTNSPINPPVEAHTIHGASRKALVSGAAMLVQREPVLAIGGFDPNIFLFWEDNDLCRRINDLGRDVLFVEAVEMRHLRGGSSATAPGLVYRMRWHQAWSRLYVFQKHGIDGEAASWVARFRRKAFLARITGASRRLERYQGSLDGALAYLRGDTALAHESLT